MMRLEIGNCIVTVDAEATRQYYRERGEVNSCTCAGCENFRALVPELPVPMTAFYRQIGVDDLRMMTEIIPFATLEDGLFFYGGFLHVIGGMTGAAEHTEEIPCYEGEGAALHRVGTKHRTFYESEKLPLTPQISVWFSTDLGLVPADFPREGGVLQLELEAHLPWVIAPEKNDY